MTIANNPLIADKSQLTDEGLCLVSPHVLATMPTIWLEMIDALFDPRRPPITHVRELIFSARLSPIDVNRHISQLVMESAQVMFGAHLPSVTMPALMFGVPTLVISGADDPIVSWESAVRTAFYHGAKHLVTSDAGHLLHVEPGAERIAHAVLHWLDEMKL